ncbi:unnamed protein product [Phytomonas sp. EM1]|nr:unnamed protein product [Phytomonas sp. EM1]|eukprot:CCW64374.1 unnamed protein product [Phytomonas sp. isolate EM1]
MISFRKEKVFLYPLLLLLFAVTTVWGHTIGVDFGSEFIKVAGPHGEQSIDIVLNEFSRRKTENVIAFRNSERFIGDPAKKLAARFPWLTVSAINLLMGLQKDSEKFENIKKILYQNHIDFSKRGSPEIQINDKHGPFSGEELYSMMLSYLHKISVNDGIVDPKGIVITIPFNTPVAGRRAIIDAAQFSSLNVLGLIHPTTAAAFYYGVRHRGFGNQTRSIVVFDIGATHTEAGIFTFSPCEKAGAFSDSFGTLTTVAILEDPTLGSHAFDLCLAEIIEEEARKKLSIGPIISDKSQGQMRSRFSLLRAANKARETLSVNTQVPYTVENIAPDKDFSSSIARESFEEKCSNLFDRVKKLALDVIALADHKVSKIHAFEMMGGVARTPKILSDLSSVIGRSVDRTLNMDEAAALGAAYYAVKLTPFYRSKSLKLVQQVPYPIYFFVEPRVNKKVPLLYRTLFENNATIGSAVSITLKRIEDFTITLLNSNSSSDVFGKIHVNGVKTALDKLKFNKPALVHPNNSHAVRIQLKVNESGLIEIEKADAIVKYATNVSQIVFENVTDASGDKIIESKRVFSIQMRHRSSPLDVSLAWLHPRGLTDGETLTSIGKLYDIKTNEERKHAAALAKNNLEEYILWARGEGVLENNDIDRQIHKVALERLSETLTTVYDWLESGHGSMDTCKAEDYNAQLSALKVLVHNVTEKPEPPRAASDPIVPNINYTKDPEDL